MSPQPAPPPSVPPDTRYILFRHRWPDGRELLIGSSLGIAVVVIVITVAVAIRPELLTIVTPTTIGWKIAQKLKLIN